MNVEPYKALVTKGDISRTEDDLSKMIVMNSDINFGLNILIPDSKIHPICLVGRECESDIEVFRNPIFFELQGKKYAAYDFRHCTKFKEGESNIKELTRNKEVLNTELTRFVLSIKTFENQNMIIPVASILATTMTHWITRLLQNNLSLTIPETMVIEVIVAYHYSYAFQTSDADESERHQLALDRTHDHMGKNSRTLVADIFDGLEYPTDIHKLTQVLSSVNSKLDGFNTQVLLTLISKTVIVPNANFTISSALEHAPTALAVINAALTQKINSRARLTNIVGKLRNIDHLTAFVERHMVDAFL